MPTIVFSILIHPGTILSPYGDQTKNQSKTNTELIKENSLLKQRIKELEQSESDRKQAEGPLKEQKTPSSTVSNLPQDSVIFLMDTKGMLLDFNENLPKSMNVRADEIAGKCVYGFLPPDVTRFRRAKVKDNLMYGFIRSYFTKGLCNEKY